MNTLAVAAAFLAGGVALGATSGVVAAELITGDDIKNRSITGKDIAKGSVPANRLKAGASEVAVETFMKTVPKTTVTGLTQQWQPGPELIVLTSEKAANLSSMWHWHGDLSAEGGLCQVQLRMNDLPGGGIAGTTESVIAPRDVATGQSSGKRVHKPLRMRLYYRGDAVSCTIGGTVNPSQVAGIMHEDSWQVQK